MIFQFYISQNSLFLKKNQLCLRFFVREYIYICNFGAIFSFLMFFTFFHDFQIVDIPKSDVFDRNSKCDFCYGLGRENGAIFVVP